MGYAHTTPLTVDRRTSCLLSTRLPPGDRTRELSYTVQLHMYVREEPENNITCACAVLIYEETINYWKVPQAVSFTVYSRPAV